jgi:N-methylhydantoinase A
MSYRISVDTGGTFTDVVVADPVGRLHIGKALTTPERAYEGLSASLDDAARTLGMTRTSLLDQTSLFTYGTTRATNAIVERKVAKTALLVTEGFPEILHTNRIGITPNRTFHAATRLKSLNASHRKER